MIRHIKLMVIMVAVITSIPCLADSKLTWQMGTDPQLLEEAKNLLLQLNNSPQTTGGIRQLVYRAKIESNENIVTQRFQKIWHFSNIEALQKYGNELIYFDDYSETVVIKEAATLNPDGQLIRFDSADVHINDSDSYNVFTNTKEIIIPYTNLKVGGIAIVDYEINVDKNRLETDWSRSFYPQNLFPREKFEVIVKLEPETKLNWASTSNWLSCQEIQSELSCVANKIPAAKSDYAVSWQDELGQLFISESEDWQHFINKTTALFNQARRNIAGIEEVYNSILKNTQTQEEKIAAIHHFVARDIRYISVSKNGHSITPHAISETLANRYGDCKDKSVLLVELLNHIGIKAYPVLVATERSNPEKLKIPAMNFFDHMVVCFNLDGEKKCLDATDSHTGWNHISAWIQGRVALELKAGSVPGIIPAKPFRWDMMIKTENIITENGGLEEKQTRKYYSEYAGSLRSNLAGKSHEEIERLVTEQYQEVISSKSDPVFYFTGLQDLQDPLDIVSSTVFEPFLDTNKDLAYVDYDYWLRNELDSLSIKNKYYDSFFPGLRVVSEFEIDISNYWKLKSGIPVLNLEHEYGRLQRQIKKIDYDKVKIITKMEIPSRKVSVRESESFNKFLSLLKRESSIRVNGALNHKTKTQ